MATPTESHAAADAASAAGDSAQVPMVRVEAVSRVYRGAGAPVTALNSVSFNLAPGEFVAITGPSGAGKSTLLHLLGGLDRPDRGQVYVAGLALHDAGDKELTHYRRTQLGMIFQFFNLMPALTVEENAALPLLLAGVERGAASRRAREMLDLVGLSHRLSHGVHQLSGGEMQRTAIARALVHKPGLLLADEPTGNLDSANAEQVLGRLAAAARATGATLALVTHSAEAAARAPRRLVIQDGRIAEDLRSVLSPTPVH